MLLVKINLYLLKLSFMVCIAYWASNGELSQAEWRYVNSEDGGTLKDAESTFRSARATFLVFVAILSIQQRGARERRLGH